MPFSISSADGVLRITLSGTLTPEALVRMADALTEAEAAAAVCPHRVTDLTGLVRFEVGFDEMFQLARRRREMAPANPIRSALVACTPVQLGFARMFQTLNDHPRITMRIFPDLDGALAWLAEEPPAPGLQHWVVG
jgi:hypothetical protein